MSLLFIWLFLGLMLVGVPIVFTMLVAPGVSLFFDGKANFYPQLLSRLFNGMFSVRGNRRQLCCVRWIGEKAVHRGIPVRYVMASEARGLGSSTLQQVVAIGSPSVEQ